MKRTVLVYDQQCSRFTRAHAAAIGAVTLMLAGAYLWRGGAPEPHAAVVVRPAAPASATQRSAAAQNPFAPAPERARIGHDAPATQVAPSAPTVRNADRHAAPAAPRHPAAAAPPPALAPASFAESSTADDPALAAMEAEQAAIDAQHAQFAATQADPTVLEAPTQ